MYWTQSPAGPQSIQYAHSSKKNKDKTRATLEPLKTQKYPADIGGGIMCTGKKNKNENILLNLELANIRENAAPAEDSTLILNGGVLSPGQPAEFPISNPPFRMKLQ